MTESKGKDKGRGREKKEGSISSPIYAADIFLINVPRVKQRADSKKVVAG